MRRRRFAGLTPAQIHARYLIEKGYVSVKGGEFRPESFATERAKAAMGDYDSLPQAERDRLKEAGR